MSKKSLRKKEPLSPIDLVKSKGVADPQICLDGSKVAFTISVADLAENRYRSDIWIASAKGGALVKATDDGLSSTPRWSPDGRFLIFLCSEKGKKMLCRILPD